MIRNVLLLLFVFCPIHSALGDIQPVKTVQNGGFELGDVGKPPQTWIFPDVCEKDGYSLVVSDKKPFAGKQCAVMNRTSKTRPEAFGNLMQVVDATQYRGKRVRFRAAVKADVHGAGCQAMLWFRVDGPTEDSNFFDNMSDRPIVTNEWKHYEIVGDIAGDATSINVGMILLGSGTAAIDDVSLEIVDRTVKTTGPEKRATPAPGLTEVRMAATLRTTPKATDATYLYPLPLAYRDQTPLTFHLQVEPAECAKAVEIVSGPGPNRVLKLTLKDVGKHQEIKVAYQSLVLVRPTNFDAVPKSANYPKQWPDETKPWLASTWCCQSDHDRIAKIAKEIRGESNDVIHVIRKALAASQTIFAEAKGHVTNLTAVEALDRKGSCTSCANFVAALLRGTGIPARVVAGYPLWTGPLQTHYIVEAYVPEYGWLPVESTMGKMPWPNFQQVNVSIVPIEHESEAKAKQRSNVAGAVPYLSLSELNDSAVGIFSVGTLGKFCDHECRMVRAIKASDAEWAKAAEWAKSRWDGWLKSTPELKGGTTSFGPRDLKATSLEQVAGELKMK